MNRPDVEEVHAVLALAECLCDQGHPSRLHLLNADGAPDGPCGICPCEAFRSKVARLRELVTADRVGRLLRAEDIDDPDLEAVLRCAAEVLGLVPSRGPVPGVPRLCPACGGPMDKPTEHWRVLACDYGELAAKRLAGVDSVEVCSKRCALWTHQAKEGDEPPARGPIQIACPGCGRCHPLEVVVPRAVFGPFFADKYPEISQLCTCSEACAAKVRSAPR